MENQTANLSPSVVAPIPKSTSADELLDMYAAEEAESSEEVSKEAAKQARVAEEVPKKILSNKLVKKLEAQDVSERVEGGDESEEAVEESSEESDSDEESGEEGQEVVKSFKAKYGEDDLDIPEEAVIPVKVNGKDVSLKVKDAVQAYVKQDEFNRNMDRRVSTVTHRERKFEQELGSVKEKAEGVIRLAAQGDYIPGIKALVKMVGLGSHSEVVALERAMMDNLDNIRKVWTDMTPDQRNTYFANRRAEEAQKELEATKQSTQRQQGEVQLQQRVQKLMAENSLSEDVFWGHFQSLVDNAVGEGHLFATPHDIKPEDVVTYHRQVEIVKKVDNALKKVNPALLEQPIADEVIALVNGHDDLSVEDIEQIVRDALGAPSKTVETLNRKVEQANSRGLRTQLKQVSSAKKADTALDDEMYEHFFSRRPVSRR